MPEIERIAVIGAGRAGRSFAQLCALNGFRTTLEDVMPAKLRSAQEELASFGELPIRFALTVEDAVHDADLAIDFVPDELESKLEIFSLLDRMAPPRTILLTPTDALSITDLASCTYRPQLCLALRGGTLIRSRFNDEAVCAAVETFLKQLGRAVELVEDTEAPMLTKNV